MSKAEIVSLTIGMNYFSGVIRSHKNSFKKMRDARIDRMVIESNKILIRLDKVPHVLM